MKQRELADRGRASKDAWFGGWLPVRASRCAHRLRWFSVATLLAISLAFGVQRWEKTYGASQSAGGNCVVQTKDGGYIITGYANSQSLWLVRADSLGDTLWTRTYKPAGCFCCNGISVAELPGQGYIVAGNLVVSGPDGGDFIYVLGTDTLGDSLWARTYHPQWGAWCLTMSAVPGGGYAIAGLVYTDSGRHEDAYLLRVDSLGDSLWTHAYGGPGNQEATLVLPLSDGGFMVTGASGSGFWDALAVRTDCLGVPIWSRLYGDGGGVYDESFCYAVAPDNGGFLFSGYTRSRGAGGFDAWLVRTDDDGDTVWTRTYGGPSDDGLGGALLSPDGGYTCFGQTFSYGAGASDYWLFKTDTGGNLRWMTTFGGEDWDDVYSARSTSDGGYIMAGQTMSFGAEPCELYLVKTDAGGSAALEFQPMQQTLDARDEPALRLRAVGGGVGVSYYLPNSGRAAISIFDAAGRRVRQVLHGRSGSGWHEVRLEARLPSGTYFVRLEIGGAQAVAKLVVPASLTD